jgi:tetratricopeptide (TPR) repeat protein
MSIKKSILISACLSGFMFATSAPVHASNLNNGIHFYKAKNYLMASKLLEKSVSESPRNWRGHYYLANAQMALGRFNTAKYHYERVRDLAPSQVIQSRAHQAIIQMENMRLNQNVASVGSNQSASATVDHEAEIQKNKSRIMAEAEAKAKFIEKSAENQIKAEKANSNFWMVNPQGEQVMVIPWERENQILRDAANNAQHVRQTAQRNADNVY